MTDNLPEKPRKQYGIRGQFVVAQVDAFNHQVWEYLGDVDGADGVAARAAAEVFYAKVSRQGTVKRRWRLIHESLTVLKDTHPEDEL